jgi:hypothetical protein
MRKPRRSWSEVMFDFVAAFTLIGSLMAVCYIVEVFLNWAVKHG